MPSSRAIASSDRPRWVRGVPGRLLRAPCACEAVEDLDFGRRKRETEDVGVLRNSFGICRPWDGHDPMLDVPAEDHLGRGHAVTLCDSHEPRVAQVDGLQRAVTLDLHTTAPV